MLGAEKEKLRKIRNPKLVIQPIKADLGFYIYLLEYIGLRFHELYFWDGSSSHVFVGYRFSYLM
jgi:hypothetical protein